MSVDTAVAVDPKSFKLNARQIAFLLSLGTVKGDKVVFSLADLQGLQTERTRTGEAEMVSQFRGLIASKSADLTDGIGTLSFKSREIKAAGFPDSALKNLNYWRAYQSAAARVAIAEGWVPSIASKYNEDADAMVITVTFSNGPGVADSLTKLRAAHAEAAAKAAAEASEDSEPATGDDSDAAPSAPAEE